MTRTIRCSKLEKDLPGLEKAPFSGDLGEEIFEKVSAEAWKLWEEDMQIKVVNEYRLDLTNSEHFDTLLDQMRIFLGLKGGSQVEVENKERGN